MANGWTLERRKRQSILIHGWEPSNYSTGPRTELGKQRASLNALKHGARSRVAKESSVVLKLTLQMQQDMLARIIQLLPYDDSSSVRG